ncbi:MAG: hypothetical protein D8M57_14060 [Candidatus Scalindua sp. AMX11]|nr:MAG: hypothetical protein DWQ00_16320 [Candidatus Scalindua sp.]NOG82277.1 hypothetical protein [Planctomycetota bacterium]RZV71432.1 MAG: hypothetical protein EX341_14770 [Candidatus Scalindua sp. SCAELEC01]TDE64304.1 MAG: hypothetical protein D8M57_14060 [Candidatus Scalindua sp. AMX11]GJQ59946.1 MAG: hypothetical protein SCALA701_27470 [Candidatus Scalindua sp.]
MSEQNVTKKLQVMLPHWIEHNNNHIAEFKKWEGEVRAESGQELAKLLEKAICDMEEAGKSLSEALEKVGGPLEGESGHHHHHH